MSLSVDEVRKIALLARLRLSAEEEQTFAPQLGRSWTTSPSSSATRAPRRGSEATPGLEAADVPAASLPREALLDNAPAALDAFCWCRR